MNSKVVCFNCGRTEKHKITVVGDDVRCNPRPCGFPLCPAFAVDNREHCPVHSPEKVLARATAIINNHFDLALVGKHLPDVDGFKKLRAAILADLKETV